MFAKHAKRVISSLILPMIIRKPIDNDYLQIFDLLDKAFAPSTYESVLVRKLKDSGKISFDLIIEEKGGVWAYICYSAAYDIQKKRIGYHLAPVAVLPEKQGRGLGQRIIRESLAALGKGYPIYVLGDPKYYSRMGFRVDKTQKCAFDPAGEHFMVISKGPLPPQEVLYEDEFMD